MANGLVGAPRAVETALEILELFDAYAKDCRDNPVLVEKTQLFEGELKRWDENRRKPLTVQGFAVWVGVTAKTVFYWRQSKDEEYAEAAQRIHNAIHADRFEGGLVGQYHANLVARSMGLSEKIEQEVNASLDNKVEIEIEDLGDVAMLSHPDDDPENPSGLLFTMALIKAGVKLPCPS